MPAVHQYTQCSLPISVIRLQPNTCIKPIDTPYAACTPIHLQSLATSLIGLVYTVQMTGLYTNIHSMAYWLVRGLLFMNTCCSRTLMLHWLAMISCPCAFRRKENNSRNLLELHNKSCQIISREQKAMGTITRKSWRCSTLHFKRRASQWE